MRQQAVTPVGAPHSATPNYRSASRTFFRDSYFTRFGHSPPFNSQHARRGEASAEEQKLVIMNAGRKRPPFPIVAGG